MNIKISSALCVCVCVFDLHVNFKVQTPILMGEVKQVKLGCQSSLSLIAFFF